MRNGNGMIPPGPDAMQEQLMQTSFCTMDCQPGHQESSWKSTRFFGVELDGISAFFDEGTGRRRGARTRRHIEAEKTDDSFLLTLPLSLRLDMTQFGETTYCAPGGLMLVSTAQPFLGDLRAMEPGGSFAHLAARVSGAALRRFLPDLDALSNLPLRIGSTAGRYLKSLFELCVMEGKQFTEAERLHLGQLLMHAIADAVHEAPEAKAVFAAARPSSHARVREAAKEFIWRNIANPQLDCAMVAGHCRVSQTYLHAAFAAASERVAVHIRETRLRQCRAALLNPAFRHRAVIDIAMDYGFVDPAVFSRAYKAHFGTTPRQERDTASGRR